MVGKFLAKEGGFQLEIQGCYCLQGLGIGSRYYRGQGRISSWPLCTELYVCTLSLTGQFLEHVEAACWVSPQREQECAPWRRDPDDWQCPRTLNMRQIDLPALEMSQLAFQSTIMGLSIALEPVAVHSEALCPKMP